MPKARAGQQSRYDGQNLARTGGLHDVVVRRASDRLVHRVVGLALGHHHDREPSAPGPNCGENFDTSEARHLLVEQNQVVALAVQQLQSIVAVHHGVDVVSLAHQEDRMRAEQVDLIIHPQDPTFVQAPSVLAPVPGGPAVRSRPTAGREPDHRPGDRGGTGIEPSESYVRTACSSFSATSSIVIRSMLPGRNSMDGVTSPGRVYRSITRS